MDAKLPDDGGGDAPDAAPDSGAAVDAAADGWDGPTPDGATLTDPLVGSWMLTGTVGEMARLDTRKGASGLEAILTPWNRGAVAFDVNVSDTSMNLTGLVALLEASCDPLAPLLQRGWTSVTIPRGADGALISPPVMTTAGDLWLPSDFCCALIDDIGLPTEPRLDPDTIAPRFQVEHVSLTRSGGRLLPWDTFVVVASEGVSAASIRAAPRLGLSGAAASVLPFEWTVDATALETSWDSVRRVRGAAAEWDPLVGASAAVVVPGGSVLDRSGNPSRAFLSPALAIADVGPPSAGFDFDRPESAWLWGGARLIGAGTTDATLCEAGGCALVTPAMGGMAGRLLASTPTELVVRYRVHLTGNYPDTASSDFWPAVLEIARPTMPVVAHRMGYGPLTAAAPLGWASDWVTAVFPIPAGQPDSQIGFRLGGARALDPGACEAAFLAQVVIESISVR